MEIAHSTKPTNRFRSLHEETNLELGSNPVGPLWSRLGVGVLFLALGAFAACSSQYPLETLSKRADYRFANAKSPRVVVCLESNLQSLSLVMSQQPAWHTITLSSDDSPQTAIAVVQSGDDVLVELQLGHGLLTSGLEQSILAQVNFAAQACGGEPLSS
jgi:hypothetical protein